MSVTITPDGENQFLVRFTDVYLSYPHLFEPYRSKRADLDPVTGKPKKGKYGAKFCFDRTNPQNRKDALLIDEKIREMAKLAFKQGLPADRYCLRDGRLLTEDMHKFFVLSASDDMPPTVVDRSRKPVTAEDELIYAGCKVNGTVRLWVQNNPDYGKRINANLVGVQFYAHSEKWSSRPQYSAEDLFDDISGEFDDDEYAGITRSSRSAATAGGGLGDDDGFDDDGFDDDDGLGL